MIDLHTHTTFSDGELIPSELVRRAGFDSQSVAMRYERLYLDGRPDSKQTAVHS